MSYCGKSSFAVAGDDMNTRKRRNTSTLPDFPVDQIPLGLIIEGIVGDMFGEKGKTRTTSCRVSWEHPERGMVSTVFPVQHECQLLRENSRVRVVHGVVVKIL